MDITKTETIIIWSIVGIIFLSLTIASNWFMVMLNGNKLAYFLWLPAIICVTGTAISFTVVIFGVYYKIKK